MLVVLSLPARRGTSSHQTSASTTRTAVSASTTRSRYVLQRLSPLFLSFAFSHLSDPTGGKHSRQIWDCHPQGVNQQWTFTGENKL